MRASTYVTHPALGFSGNLKLDESCISDPKSEISDWTGPDQADAQGVQFAISDFGSEMQDSSNFEISPDFVCRCSVATSSHQRLSWRIATTSGRDPGQNPKSHHANDAYANPSRGNMEQMCRDRKPRDKNDVSDHVQAK